MLRMNTITSKAMDQQVLVEQIRIMYRSLLPIAIVNLTVSLALVYGLSDKVPRSRLNLWLGLMVFLFLLRIISYMHYQRYFTPARIRRFALYFVIGSGLTGLSWGVGGVFLFPENDQVYQIFLLSVIVGMGAGAISSLTTYLPAFFAYFPASLIPVIPQLLFTDEQIHFALALMIIAYTAALSYFAININRAIKQSLLLRFENLDLVDQLREQKEEAEHANVAKTRFLAAASHDLRQPLHALTLFTSVLDESIQYPKVRRVVDQIKASVHALQSLFNALLDISRLEAGMMIAEKTHFALQPMFDKLANDFTPQASEKGLKISWPDTRAFVFTDPNLLEQILRNYIANAIRYTNKGGVQVACEPVGNGIKISVVDTGQGIPAEELDAIFEEFHQLNNPERDRSKGLGLGLAIVQRTARLLDHPFDVTSRLGQGSSFSITVDLSSQSVDALSAPQPVEKSPLPREKVLVIVIDDEASVREGTQTLLETWGCDVICAAETQEALTLLKQQDRPPDGIIADYRLRENQTGVETIKKIHAEYTTDIPSLIVTGDIAAERLREVNNSGFQVLHKPVAPVKLRTFLRNVQLHKSRNLSTKGA